MSSRPKVVLVQDDRGKKYGKTWYSLNIARDFTRLQDILFKSHVTASGPCFRCKHGQVYTTRTVHAACSQRGGYDERTPCTDISYPQVMFRSLLEKWEAFTFAELGLLLFLAGLTHISLLIFIF